MISKALLIFFTAFIISCITMPNIIKIAVKRLLFDEHTEERKIHTKDISNLGGLGIFTGFFFCILMFQVVCDSIELGSLAAAAVLLFFVALKDDLSPTSPISRLIYQVIIAAIIVFFGQVHFIHIPIFEADSVLREAVNIVFSLIFIVGMVNAFNFIDGVDGLAATIGLYICLTFGYLFYQYGELSYCYTSWALGGALLGFLIFNFSPAKIFMGDMGSMLIGVFVAIFGIKLSNIGALTQPLVINYPGTIMFALLIVPIMDFLTVILIRLYLRKSPFHADKRHLHHRLLGLNFSHPAICLTLLGFNVLTSFVALWLQNTNSAWWPGLSTLVLAILIEVIVLYVYLKKNPQSIEC